MPTESGVQGRAYNRGTSYFFRCGNWTLESDPVLQEDTNAETGGHAHRAKVKFDHKLTIMVYVDSTHQPEEAAPAIVEGTDVNFDLQVGTLNWYTQWVFEIGTVSLKGCDANGLVTYDVTAYAQGDKPGLVGVQPGA